MDNLLHKSFQPANTRLRVSKKSIWGIIVGGLLIISTLARSELGGIRLIGEMSILLLLLLANLLFFEYSLRQSRMVKLILPVMSAFGLFALAYFVGLLRFVNQNGVKNVLQLLLLFSFFSLASQFQWSNQSIQGLAIIASAFFFIHFAWWVLEGFPVPFKGYFSHNNTFGGFVGFLTFFPIFAHKSQRSPFVRIFLLIGACIGLLLTINSYSRTMWLVAATVLITYSMWRVLLARRLFFSSYLIMVFLVICLFVYFYGVIATSENFFFINSLVRRYTQGNFFSGREILWSGLIPAIFQKPIFGYGPGTVPGDIIYSILISNQRSLSLSSHNLFIQIGIQVGLLGVLLFFWLIWRIWKVFWYGRGVWGVSLAGSFLVGILVHQVFEVSLTQNNLTVGLLQWLILGIGVAKSVYHSA
jgi:O-antigen ligase